jgi:hypothetical protein
VGEPGDERARERGREGDGWAMDISLCSVFEVSFIGASLRLVKNWSCQQS